MSLSRRMRRAALKQNMKAAANKQNNAFFNNKSQLDQDDAFLSNILSQIGSKPFLKKVLLNAIGLTLMATTPNFAGQITPVAGTRITGQGTEVDPYVIKTQSGYLKGNTAFNAFKQFQLDNGEIANMMLGNEIIQTSVTL